MENRSTRAGPAVALGGSLAAAAASVLLVRALTYDAWGWLIWGREIVGQLPFTTSGYPTWKPFTGLIAIALAPLGAAAPLLWLTIARFGAVLALVLAFQLGRRVAGVWAGALAAASLLLMPDWLYQAGLGGSEPLLTALLLAAVARHADRHDGSGFALVLGAALLRPESWPLLLASGAVTWRRRPGLRPLVVAGALGVGLLWFGGDYLGSGDPFRGGHLARWSRAARLAHSSAEPAALEVLVRASQAVPFVLIAGIPVALVQGWRRRDPVLLPLAIGGLVWLGEVVVLAALGYAGLTRFLFPAAGALAVVGAAGVVSLVRSQRSRPGAALVLAAVLVALAVPSSVRVAGLHHQAVGVESRADLEQSISRVIARTGIPTLRAPHAVSVAGLALPAFAWRVEVLPRTLHRWHFPGLRLAAHDRRWRPFWRAVHRRRHRFAARTVAREGPLYLISVQRR
jgi:hypothetical protein